MGKMVWLEETLVKIIQFPIIDLPLHPAFKLLELCYVGLV
jgi:hypothetical protein